MKPWQVAVALLALEVALVLLFVSDPSNWDCGGPCSTYSRVLGALWIWVIPVCLVVLLGTTLARAGRRRRRDGSG